MKKITALQITLENTKENKEQIKELVLNSKYGAELGLTYGNCQFGGPSFQYRMEDDRVWTISEFDKVLEDIYALLQIEEVPQLEVFEIVNKDSYTVEQIQGIIEKHLLSEIQKDFDRATRTTDLLISVEVTLTRNDKFRVFAQSGDVRHKLGIISKDFDAFNFITWCGEINERGEFYLLWKANYSHACGGSNGYEIKDGSFNYKLPLGKVASEISEQEEFVTACDEGNIRVETLNGTPLDLTFVARQLMYYFTDEFSEVRSGVRIIEDASKRDIFSKFGLHHKAVTVLLLVFMHITIDGYQFIYAQKQDQVTIVKLF